MPRVNLCMTFLDKLVCRFLLDVSLPIQVIVASVFTKSLLADRRISMSPLTFGMEPAEKSRGEFYGNH